ncbi:MAG: hypothetical protein LQ338_001716 [Usnochroma carphineum]|nr:MAG: hypothetical protein LQ338_001716 [Usnochroma carphineum]
MTPPQPSKSNFSDTEDSRLGLTQGMKAYYDAGRFTDLTISCAGQDFKCHKVVVCPQSSFFEAACTNGFQESLSSKIELVDDHPYHVALMVEFLYTQEYTAADHFAALFDVKHPEYVFKAHISLYAMGDKYGVPRLCRYSSHRFHESAHPRGLFTTLNCVPLIYSSTPDTNRTLRDQIVSNIIQSSKGVASDEECKKEMRQHVDEIQQFREDLIQGLLDKCGANNNDPSKTSGTSVRVVL